ncbi:HET-domain-containing protein, partial [Stipitochalara longipes BDJ]
MKCQMLVSTLPQTIQDAITVTRKLGEKYLWIDSLCIIQDSETDKLQEIGRMDEVYKNAFLTISAASGKGCHDGFLGRRNMAEEIPFPYECPDDTFSGILSSGFIQEVSHSVAREPIDFRAWTMQESMLAQRLLCYGCEQISWICPNRLETFDSPLPPLRYGVAPLFIPEQLMLKEHGPASDISGGLDWMMIVEDYTSRQLSYQTDKLSAISSLAKQWSGTFRKEDGPYVAGLFLNKITSHLMWFAQKEAPRPVVPPYVAPTWSWASIDGPVTYRGYKKLHG